MNIAGRLEEKLAALLCFGSWLACATIGVGYALALIGSHAPDGSPASLSILQIIRAGIALFILLPILRVLVMLLVFIREGDYRFAFISGMVLAIILLGIFLGVAASSRAPDDFPT